MKQHYLSSPVSLTDIKVDPSSTDGHTVFRATVRQNAASVVDERGVVVKQVPAKEFAIETAADWGAQGWMLFAMAQLQ